MRLFSQEFEYYIENIRVPTLADFEAQKNNKEKYKVLLRQKEFFTLWLNELGASGWELTDSWDDSEEDKESRSVRKLIYRRSSRSRYFGTGPPANQSRIDDLAKQLADTHPAMLFWD